MRPTSSKAVSPEDEPHETGSIAYYLERAGWLQLRALACLRQARDDPSAPRLPTRRRRAWVRAGHQQLQRAYQLVRAARQLADDSEQTVVLDQHLAKLQTLLQRIEEAAVQAPDQS